MAGRTPDFVLKALNKETDKKGKVGAAWENDDRSVSISLDPFVVLSGQDSIVLTLFPWDTGDNNV